MTAALFTPYRLGPIELPNRVVVAPMCQYSAADGCMTDWHLQHLMTLAMSGAGHVVVEATGVTRHGRITHGCTGIYSDACEYAMARALAAARSVAAPGTSFGIQLGHAGRKASSQRPWEGGRALGPDQDPWQTLGPVAEPHDAGWHVPKQMDEADMAAVIDAFVAAAKRSLRLGFESIELHMAHGYLLQQFLSPVSNTRTDSCGGSLENRMRFPLRIATAARAVVPRHVALGARLSASDFAPGGWEIGDTIMLAERLAALGLDFVCLSGGGPAKMRPPVAPGYQVPFARAVKEKVKIGVRAVGMIFEPQQANQIVAEGSADLVAMARAFLDDPRWVWRAADALGAEIKRPVQYERVAPALWPGHAERRAKAA
jgi:2,4-dienoyl-CoA reductase-like NADH-dependent reductase (Old Yellow Enzyme family)